MRKIYLAILLIFIFHNVYADSWPEPTLKRYYSNNMKYMLKVVPTYYSTKYYKWKGASQKKKRKFTEIDTTVIPCHAILYNIQNIDTSEVWRTKLINKRAPNFALIADDGLSIVTFDNRASLGYGNVFVVYKTSLNSSVKKYRLEEFSPYPIYEYFRSISSIWWLCGAKYLDNERIEICCENEKKDTTAIIYNVSWQAFEQKP